MAFFDDLNKTITQAGQTAAQKTREIAELAKMNSKISQEERKINENYVQIGKLYVSLYREENNKEFESYLTEIRNSEEKLREYKKQINDLKGIVICEKCGGEVPLGSAFCNLCGATLPIEKSAEEENYDEIVTEGQPVSDDNASEEKEA